MPNFQQDAHPEGHDYVAGSPHLRHNGLRNRISESVRNHIVEIEKQKGSCKVLEVGAGHGTFTEAILESVATVTVTEMSKASADYLAASYGANSGVSVIYDPTGDWLLDSDESFDIVLCISVLHHIPDYESFLKVAFAHTYPGGAFVSWQDPLYYPRRSLANLALERFAYYSWRVLRGNLWRGLLTRLRRVRGILDESNPSDMVEYHVVRKGVDEMRLMELGAIHFDHTQLHTYFSTQSTIWQKLETVVPANSFALSFRGRK